MVLSELAVVVISKNGLAKAYKLTEDQISSANGKISVTYAETTGREIRVSRHIDVTQEAEALFP